jgi:hypothetical protein
MFGKRKTMRQKPNTRGYDRTLNPGAFLRNNKMLKEAKKSLLPKKK